jgi:hypothetical protein
MNYRSKKIAGLFHNQELAAIFHSEMAIKFRQDLCPMTLNKSLTFVFVEVRDQ